MQPSEQPLHEVNPWSRPVRDLGLTIKGAPLDDVLKEFQAELSQRGITRVQPTFYLSDEWGVVPEAPLSIAIPFYLARADLTELHATRLGLVEGMDRTDILRYLRHEMGHVMAYAYRLDEEAEWCRLFGDCDQEYKDEYRARPFHPAFVRHLPGWYAQKHPQEDWAETFAVWLTPGLDWRRRYADTPVALAKLEYCDRTIAAVRDREPLVTAAEPDEEVSKIGRSVEEFYQDNAPRGETVPIDLDEALQTVFAALPAPVDPTAQPPHSAAVLLRRLEQPLATEVYRWTSYFPERTLPLVRQLADRAEELGLTYPAEREAWATVAVTAFVTTLALNRVQAEGQP
jgi:hypothetical protein